MVVAGLSLFSGAGGMDVGFTRAGVCPVGAVELNPAAVATYRVNHPGVPVVEGDIQHRFDAVVRLGAGVDVVFGGPPCQGFSVAGRMDPADPRSGLVWSFLDVVAAVRPRVVVLENVRALGVFRKWAGVRAGITGRLEGLGYAVVWRVVNAADVGVAQSRERVFVIGVYGGDARVVGRVDRVLGEARQDRTPVGQVLRQCGRAGGEGNPLTCTARVVLTKKPVLRRSPFAGMLVNGARPLDLGGVAGTLPASMGGNLTPIVDDRVLWDGGPGWFVAYHRFLMAGGVPGGMGVPPEWVRRLTLVEAAAVQSFPVGYRFCGSVTSRYGQIGNAVPPRLAEVVARAALVAAGGRGSG